MTTGLNPYNRSLSSRSCSLTSKQRTPEQTAYIAQLNLLAIYNLFMQNKPNVKITRQHLTLCAKRTYRKFLGKCGKKANPNKPKANPIKPNQTQFKLEAHLSPRQLAHHSLAERRTPHRIWKMGHGKTFGTIQPPFATKKTPEITGKK